MRYKLKHTLSLMLMILTAHYSSSQVLYNNGANIIVKSGASIMVEGSMENGSGDVANDGYINVTQDITNQSSIFGNGTFSIQGNWINNASFLGNTSNQNLVILNGSNTQFIQGSAVTTFYDLELTNGTLKKMFIDAGVNHNLLLHNQELATETYKFYVYNTNVNAITRDNNATYGFVSSINNGRLVRNTNSTGTYLFPTGSSLNTLRYRPVEITPADANNNTFEVSLVNNNADADGYDRTQNDGSFCVANPDFYHNINRTNGTSNAGISIFYNETDDGLWEHSAFWNGSQWNNMDPVNHTTASPLNNVTKSTWSDFSNDPYILINVSPQVSFTGLDTAYCINDPASTLTGNPAGGTFSGTGISGNTFTPATAGTYDIIYTYDDNGCIGADTQTVTVHQLPVVSINPATAEICPGDTITLTASGADTYTWSPATDLNTTTGAVVNSFTQSNITYTVTGTSNSCSATATVDITVNDLTITSFDTNNASCGGADGSATVNVNGGSGSYTYSWNTSPVQNTQTAQNLSFGTYTVTVNDGNCSVVDSVNINENGAPTLNVSADISVLCEGDTATITATGADSYTWTPASGLSVDTGSIVQASPQNTTTYTVVGTTNGCSTQSQITINVNDLSVDSVIVNDEVCSASNGSINLNVSGGTGNYSFSWDTNPVQNGNPATNLQAGTYSVTVSDGECQLIENNISIANTGSLNITVSNDTVICLGESVTLTASGADSYTWSPANGLNTTTGSSVISSTGETVTYQVIGVSGACSDTADVTVTVDDLKVSIITQNADCGQSNGSATASVTGGIGSYSYLWNTTPAQTTDAINNIPGGTYQVSVTDDYCTAVASGDVGENGSPQITVTASETEICQGSNTILTASGATNYVWTPSSSLSSDTGVSVVASPNQTTTYTVTGTNGACSGQASITIKVSDSPEVTFYPTSPEICKGEDISITVGTGNSYYWADGPGIIDNTNNTQIVSPNQTYTYYVTVSNGACQSSGSITVTVNQPPNVDISASDNYIIAGQSTTLTATGAQEYTWSPASSLSCTNCNPVVATPDAQTIYYVEGTDANGCVGTDTITIFVSYDNEIYIPSAFSPNNDSHNDVLYVRGRGIKKLYFAVYNRWGELVFETKDQNIGWDGTYKGKALNPAVFVYYVNATFYDNKKYEYKGSVTLVK